MQKQPAIILVNPQLAENVGMAARAMMNCGLDKLRLVAPREDHLSPKAVSASSNAEEILYKAKIYPTTVDAIADLQHVYASTARHRDQIKEVCDADAAAGEISRLLQQNVKCGIMFGCERTGLHNNDVCLADSIINVPLNPRHCSLNLSQAVLLVGYEFYKTQIEKPEPRLEMNGTELAEKGKVVKFLEHIEDELAECGNYRIGEKREKMVINLRNIFTRAHLTEQELNTLYGVINYLAHKKDV